MTKIRNQRFYSEDHDWLKNLAEEFAYIGREHKLDLKNGTLTVFALPQRKRKGKRKHDKPERNKRAESAGRHLTGR